MDAQLTKNTTEKSYHCGLFAALDVVAGRWKVFIIWCLNLEPKRFGELRRLVPGISEKMLTQQLRELEADGIVVREDYQTNPPKVEYSLSENGIKLKDALEPLCAWGADYMIGIGARTVAGNSQTKNYRRSLSEKFKQTI